MSFWTHQIPSNLKFCLSPSKEKKELFVLKKIRLKIFKDIFLIHTTVFLIPPSNLEIRDTAIFLNFSFDSRIRNGTLPSQISWLNNVLKQFIQQVLFSVCVCRSSILFILMLNLVNLLGVFLDCLSKSHRLVFNIDLH